MTPSERLRHEAQEHELELGRRLLQIALHGENRDSLQAIKLIHERMYGRPTTPEQPVIWNARWSSR
jgi:hypothetical protein